MYLCISYYFQPERTFIRLFNNNAELRKKTPHLTLPCKLLCN